MLEAKKNCVERTQDHIPTIETKVLLADDQTSELNTDLEKDQQEIEKQTLINKLRAVQNQKDLLLDKQLELYTKINKQQDEITVLKWNAVKCKSLVDDVIKYNLTKNELENNIKNIDNRMKQLEQQAASEPTPPTTDTGLSTKTPKKCSILSNASSAEN